MIRIILFLALIIHLPLSAKRVHSTQSSLELENLELQTTLYISNLEKRRKQLSIQREGELDIRRFKEMRLYRSSFHRDMLIKHRDRL